MPEGGRWSSLAASLWQLAQAGAATLAGVEAEALARAAPPLVGATQRTFGAQPARPPGRLGAGAAGRGGQAAPLGARAAGGRLRPQRRALVEQLGPPLHREARADPDVVQPALVVVEPEQQRADHRPGLVVTE